jgi:intracellular multiplication protein IcmK
MTYGLLRQVFCAIVCGVLSLQNTTLAQTAGSARDGSSGEGFPSRAQAKGNWDKLDPKTESQTARGPSTQPDPPPKNSLTAPSLPDPKIDPTQEALEAVSPMSAEDIRKFGDEMYKRGREMAKIPGGPYEVKGIRVEKLSFEPGAKPKLLSVGLNKGVDVSFIDKTGAPMIIDYVKSFSDAFTAGVPETADAKKNGGSLTFEVEAKRIVGEGNVLVRLNGVSMPIAINVTVGHTNEVDGIVQFIVPLALKSVVLPGDRAEASTGQNQVQMQGFLAGIPPDDAIEVKVKEVEGVHAWMWRNKLYLRTQYAVMSPGWFQRQAAGDGTAAYELPLTSLVRLGIEGRETEVALDYPFIPPAVSAGSGRAAMLGAKSTQQ